MRYRKLCDKVGREYGENITQRKRQILMLNRVTNPLLIIIKLMQIQLKMALDESFAA